MKYDDTNPMSIKAYGELLIGKTFRDVLNEADMSLQERAEAIHKVNNARYKGGIGHVIEKYHFEYDINSNQEPDFPKAGIELKVTPYERKKKEGFSAGERLVITMISYQDPVEPDLYQSHVYKKFQSTLLIHYLRNKELQRVDYPIHYVTLFTPPEEDMKIIQEDYEKIIKKVAEGRADELSEGDTMYLGACTKGANAEKSTVPQAYYAPETLARKRAFCFKTSYMTTILNKYVMNTRRSNNARSQAEPYDAILENLPVVETNLTFEQLIVATINQYIGKTGTQLAKQFEVKIGSKQFYSQLAFRMLGVKSNNAAEFVKAGIDVKAIRIEVNGHMRESISFPVFKFNELITEQWEDAALHEMLRTKRFLFVVYQKVNEDYVLKGCKLWNMNNQDLEEARRGWVAVQRVAIDGPIFTKVPIKNGFTIDNNFPKKSDNKVIHIRPHAKERYYVLENGEIIGNDPKYGDSLPDGRVMTKQSFWLNNNYVLTQIQDIIE